MHAIFQHLHFIGLFHQRAEPHTDFTLSCSSHFVVMHFDIQPHLLHGGTHGATNIVQGVDRWHGEVASFNAWTVASIAFLKIVVGAPGSFF